MILLCLVVTLGGIFGSEKLSVAHIGLKCYTAAGPAMLPSHVPLSDFIYSFSLIRQRKQCITSDHYVIWFRKTTVEHYFCPNIMQRYRIVIDLQDTERTSSITTKQYLILHSSCKVKCR